MWNYRTTFSRSIFGFGALYLLLVHLFALALWGFVVINQRRRGTLCLDGWLLESGVRNYVVAFEASWTTISTVGFGAVSPPNDEPCHIIRFTLAFEAFVGVIFAGFCSAILFAKMQRIEFGASVKFSSCLCLQFGEGVTDAKVNVVDSVGQLGQAIQSSEVTPFPVLEMRIVNTEASPLFARRHDDGSERAIIDGTVSCVATFLRLVSDEDVASAADVFSAGNENATENVGNIAGQHMTLKRKFEVVKMTPDRHPNFTQGSLYCRHVLDQDSPLLRSTVRDRIRISGGWPSDLNDATKIQGCLSKDIYDINVTFTGTSNWTSDSVFKMHNYRLRDIYTGWTFVKLGYVAERNNQDAEPEIRTDLTLLHDIVPQRGGRNEPLGSMRKSQGNLMSFLASVSED